MIELPKQEIIVNGLVAKRIDLQSVKTEDGAFRVMWPTPVAIRETSWIASGPPGTRADGFDLRTPRRGKFKLANNRCDRAKKRTIVCLAKLGTSLTLSLWGIAFLIDAYDMMRRTHP